MSNNAEESRLNIELHLRHLALFVSPVASSIDVLLDYFQEQQVPEPLLDRLQRIQNALYVVFNHALALMNQVKQEELPLDPSIYQAFFDVSVQTWDLSVRNVIEIVETAQKEFGFENSPIIDTYTDLFKTTFQQQCEQVNAANVDITR